MHKDENLSLYSWLETVPVAHSGISPLVILPGHMVGSSFAMVHLFA